MATPLLRFAALTVCLSLAGCSGEPPGESLESDREFISGGVDDTGTLANPAVVMITHNGGACTGSLIAPKLVLTARHCVSDNVTQGIGCDIYGNSSNGDHVGNDYPASAFKIYTGVNPNFGSPVATGVQVLHPPGKNLCNNDIALIVLNQAVAITPLAVRLDWPPQIGETTTAVGYGAINDFQQGSGKRRRKSNVPVVSYGQDWNQLTGIGELAMGPAACSGDSGGPVISSKGAVIGVASRVASCSDPNGRAIYVRLDHHKNLILQGFAAAGASPKHETGSAPPPLVKKPLADGPCQTGAQCLSAICQTNGNYCTEFCGQTPCSSSSTYCADASVAIFGQSIDDKFCVPLPKNTPCEQCRSTECVNLTSACLNSAACTALLACADACTDEACHESCLAQHAAGAADYTALQQCACTSSCQSVCSHQCYAVPGTGGSSGSGGSAGLGGAGGSGAGGAAASGGSGVGGSGVGGGAGIPGDGGLTPVDNNREVQGCTLSRASAPAGGSLLALLAALALGLRRRR